jgi:hypothetical protein
MGASSIELAEHRIQRRANELSAGGLNQANRSTDRMFC